MPNSQIMQNILDFTNIGLTAEESSLLKKAKKEKLKETTPKKHETVNQIKKKKENIRDQIRGLKGKQKEYKGKHDKKSIIIREELQSEINKLKDKLDRENDNNNL